MSKACLTLKSVYKEMLFLDDLLSQAQILKNKLVLLVDSCVKVIPRGGLHG